MKVLTSVTIIIMIPNLIASMYGMNVELPFQHSINAFHRHHHGHLPVDPRGRVLREEEMVVGRRRPAGHPGYGRAGLDNRPEKTESFAVSGGVCAARIREGNKTEGRRLPGVLAGRATPFSATAWGT
jgi:hypothetical protein